MDSAEVAILREVEDLGTTSGLQLKELAAYESKASQAGAATPPAAHPHYNREDLLF